MMDLYPYKDLNSFFDKKKKYALGFSGGVDSSYLLYAAKMQGANIVPYFVKSQFQPQFELEDAKRICKQLDVHLTVICLDVLKNEIIVSNPWNRCYYCKKTIFTALKEQSLKDGCHYIIDGTNASDDVSDRPGMKAIEELSVLSPLKMAGLTKADVRRLSKDAGLFTADKDAYACLATRIPTDTVITNDDLLRVENSESMLFSMGYKNFRVRVQGKDAKIQMTLSDMSRAINDREKIVCALKPYFKDILLYLQPRGEKE